MTRQAALTMAPDRRAASEPELLDPVAHLVAVDAEQLPGVRLVATRALERLHQQLPLDLLEVDALGRQPERRASDAVRVSVVKSSGASQSRSMSSIARSMALRSSRTLPGQPVLLEQLPAPSGVSPRTRLRNSRLKRSM